MNMCIQRKLLVLLALMIAAVLLRSWPGWEVKAQLPSQEVVAGEDGTSSCDGIPGSCTDFRWTTRLLKSNPPKRQIVFFIPSTTEEPTFGFTLGPETAAALADSIRLRAEDLR